ncbi:MAG: acyl-CoA dehydrogenase family protein, partial [Alphaproteobacteria bacterium]|nr:acyl-CoA dehydrogenase family protein [Alphaproteobacteria bacterium]
MRLSEPSWMNEEYEILRDSVRRFIAAEIEPHYEAWEEAGIVPREIWNRLGEHGFLAPDMPEQYGGAGGSYQHLALIIAEFARLGFATFAGSMIGVHSAIVNHYILNHGSEEQKRRYLPAMASGDMVAAIAMTEPGAGSDLQGIRTVAVRDGNGYILNGSKTFISNGQQCDFVVVVAKTDNTVAGAKGISLLFVEKDAAGFSRGRNLDKIGLHSADTSELFFDDVRVDGGAVLGAEHGGFAVLMEELPRERLTLAISGLAAAEGALQWTIDYVRERQIFGKPVADFQNTRFKIAEMMTEARA